MRLERGRCIGFLLLCIIQGGWGVNRYNPFALLADSVRGPATRGSATDVNMIDYQTIPTTTGWAWFNGYGPFSSQDLLKGGFQANFQYSFGSFANTEPGRGFTFAWQTSPNASGSDGGNYGFSDLRTSGFAVLFRWDTNTIKSTIITTQDKTLSPTSPDFDTQISINDTGIHDVTIQLDVLSPVPLLELVIDNHLIFSQQVLNLGQILGPSVYPGFTASFEIDGGSLRYAGNFDLLGGNLLVPSQQPRGPPGLIVTMPVPAPNRFEFACPRMDLYGFAGPNSQTNPLVNAHRYVGWEVTMNPTLSFQGSSVWFLATTRQFVAPSLRPDDIIGCLFEFRFQNAIVPTNGLWKCVSNDDGIYDSDLTWTSSNDTSDLNWPAAVGLGYNTWDQLNTTGYWKALAIATTAQRFWGAPNASKIACKMRLPRFCAPNDTSQCIAGQQNCNNLTRLCQCAPPYSGIGDNCTLSTPIITSIVPASGPSNQAFTVRVTGSLFYNNPALSCCLGGICSANTARFISTTQVECNITRGQGNTTLSIRNVNDAKATSLPTSLYIYQAFTVTSILTPNPISLLQKKTNITIGGTFDPTETVLRYTCIFDGVSVYASNIASTQIQCEAPTHPNPLAIAVGVTLNGFFVLQTSNLFTWVDDRIPYCRAPPSLSDFDFLDRNPRPYHYPLNVALDATVIANATSTYSMPGVADGDFCCFPSTEAPDGISCGLFYDIHQINELGYVQVALQFKSAATINEVVTSWNTPCTSLPNFYNVWYLNDAGTWSNFTVRRDTQGNSTCQSFMGDNTLVAYCIDYFAEVNTTAIMITFENIPDNLPQDSDGGWLYEVAAYGTYQDYPYYILVNDTLWTNPLPLTGPQIILPPLQLSSVTKWGGAPSVMDYTVNLVIQMSTSDPTTTPEQEWVWTTLQQTSVLLSQIGSLSISLGDASTNSPALPGQYQIQIYSLQVGTAVTILPFQIAAGTPSSLVATLSSTTYLRADAIVEVPVVLFVLDSLGNPVTSNVTYLVSSSTNTAPIWKTTNSNTLTSSGSLKTSILIQSPAASSDTQPSYHILNLSLRNYAISTTLSVPIVRGYASKMKYVGPLVIQINLRDASSIPALVITDGAGNPPEANSLNRIQGMNITLTNAVGTLGEPVSTFFGSAPIINNTATFTNFQLVGRRGSNFNLTFTAPPSSALVTTVIVVSIVPCPFPTAPSNVNTQIGQCVCKRGYGQSGDGCVLCTGTTYKSTDTNDTCAPCALNKVSRFDGVACQCSVQFYNDSQGLCESCPSGARCQDDIIAGNLEGYWASLVTDPLSGLYLCSKSNNPTSVDLDAASQACPTSVLFPTQCGQGYSGVRCLVCSEGYGANGPYCKACPTDPINYTIVSLAILFIVAVVVFLVYQGRTPKNKESVSMKILLNHIQMLGLISSLGAVWSEPFFSAISLGSITSLIDSRVISIDCAFPFSYYYKLAFFYLAPWVLLAFVVVLYLIFFLFKAFIFPLCGSDSGPAARDRIKKSILSQCIMAIIITTFFIYPAVCIKVLEIFDCSVQADGISYLTSAPSESCDTSTYRTYLILGIVMLIVYCFGAPAFALFCLWKFRNSESELVKMPLRFFYDGFKPKRYYWEILILLRKFLISLFIILFRDNILHQTYGIIFVIQAALIVHVLLHPYTSGRQFRLELWSLIAILITVFSSLYIIAQSKNGQATIGISAMVFVIHIVVILGFLFFIGRGLIRKFFYRKWTEIRSWYTRVAPKRFQKKPQEFKTIINFFQRYAGAQEYDRDILISKLNSWWITQPNYKRRRLVAALAEITDGTPYDKFLGESKQLNRTQSVLDDDAIELAAL